tara:strand:+ start:1263 stop:2204 length:942 start_codon:yes stop_codon:yes gene_type:complete
MKKHLLRKNICGRKLESYDFDEEKLEYLSMLNKSEDEIIITKDDHNIIDFSEDWEYDENKLKYIIEQIKNTNSKKCCFCNKMFFRKYELLRHIENHQCCVIKEKKNKKIILNNYIDKKTIQNINNQQINNQQINNISINVFNNSKVVNEDGEKILNGFSEDWDISKIDLHKKLLLFVSDNKYSNTMEEILKNDKNMNILLGENKNESIVFEEDKFLNVSNDEIIIKTMYKLYNHLLKFYTDIKNENIINNDLNKHKNNLKEKYDDFNNNNITKEIVKNILLDIFHNKKEEVLEKFSEFNKYLSIDQEKSKIGF